MRVSDGWISISPYIYIYISGVNAGGSGGGWLILEGWVVDRLTFFLPFLHDLHEYLPRCNFNMMEERYGLDEILDTKSLGDVTDGKLGSPGVHVDTRESSFG